MTDNPFLIKGYKSPDYFCDRKNETEVLMSNIANGADTTIIAPRKYGKSGLILHTFYNIEKEGLPFVSIYVDILATLTLNDFIKALADAILTKFPEKTILGDRFMNLIRSLRPTLSHDSMTGQPQVEFNFMNETQQQHTLKSLLEFLNNQEKKVVLAIDEFQQITEYPEKNVEALLRSYMQQMHNVRFIYSGSKRAIMTEMFLQASRPFFSSTRTLSIGRIEPGVYASFIRSHFKKIEVMVDDEAMNQILEWTKCHTFYTQSLCNAIYAMRPERVTLDVVNEACNGILERETAYYLQYREMLTTQQWRILIGIAKEDSVRRLTSSEFLTKYKIGSATNCRRAVESLVKKELILEIVGLQQTEYSIYDVFFSRWLRKNY